MTQLQPPSDDLAELLEASLLLARPEQLCSDEDRERVHAWIELLLLEGPREQAR